METCLGNHVVKVSTIFCHKLILFSSLQMSALKSANKELKGMMKTVKIQDIDVCNHSISFFSLTTFENFWC